MSYYTAITAEQWAFAIVLSGAVLAWQLWRART